MLRLQPGAADTITPNDGVPLSINTIYQDPRGPVLVTALDGRLFQVERHTLVPVNLPFRASLHQEGGRASPAKCMTR
jgi:hypothetical protein